MNLRVSAAAWTFAFVLGVGSIGFPQDKSSKSSQDSRSAAAAMSKAAQEMADAANTLMAALSPEQLRQAKFLFLDEERRNIHYFPVPRRGLPLKDMNTSQQQLAYALLSTGLSMQGYVKALTIMSIGQVLREMDPNNPNPLRDPEYYYLSIFGTPGPTGVWGYRLEGFHISISFTIVDGKQIAIAPSFMGVHPATNMDGPRKGLRVMSQEEDLARKLATSLDEKQRKIAFYEIPVFLEETVGGLLTANARKIENFEPFGIPASQMTADQVESLWELIQVTAHRHRAEVAETDLARIERAGKGKIYFRWSGSLEPGKGHHYIVQGPTFLIEYDNTQDDANHVHCMWRDLENDFGDNLIRKHYELHHKGRPGSTKKK